ncbi:MAG TPA: CPBP family intramembrane glutamic endopeptidase [Euzebyales bacterium]|nr:CPBP family intramembrane glutamic endopeptidase [Euzebyales bacterium]
MAEQDEVVRVGYRRGAGRQMVVVAVGLLIAWLPLYLAPAMRWFGVDSLHTGPRTQIAWNWVATLALVAYILRVERRSLRSILLRTPGVKDVEWAFYAFGIAMTYSWLVGMVRPQTGNEGVETITAMPFLAVCALVVTTAITEEVLYRGYPIQRLSELTHRRWLGTMISVAVFVLPHLTFFGAEWLLYQGFGTILLYGLYLWRSNLWVCMLFHGLTNAPILIPTVLS